jgi:hypothetical protein
MFLTANRTLLPSGPRAPSPPPPTGPLSMSPPRPSEGEGKEEGDAAMRMLNESFFVAAGCALFLAADYVGCSMHNEARVMWGVIPDDKD